MCSYGKELLSNALGCPGDMLVVTGVTCWLLVITRFLINALLPLDL